VLLADEGVEAVVWFMRAFVLCAIKGKFIDPAYASAMKMIFA
jgi:hypothetical protein